MPARSKSQQRLFGMVHAYNKGEFHGSRSLRNRIAALSKHISEDDAEHFARTSHEDLPEKTAQAIMSPNEVNDFYGKAQLAAYATSLTPRSERRRSFLGSVLRGTVTGTLVGGVGAGALGAYLAHKATENTPGVDQAELQRKMREAALRMGAWGATRGATLGSVAGAGLNIIDRIRG